MYRQDNTQAEGECIICQDYYYIACVILVYLNTVTALPECAN